MLIFLVQSNTTALAALRAIDLTVENKIVNFTGKSTQAIAVNQQIPAPTLHFKEGDTVTIRVHNQLNKPTAIHWHGLLVPWQMDGVAGVNQTGIPPKGDFQYQFTLKQSGTYWYHAHAGLQEQLGLYGAFIIDPRKQEPYHATKDFVIMLSDWSNTQPEQILKNLKKSGDYYAPNLPLQSSLMRFIQDYHSASPADKKLVISDYQMMQHMRMGLYDISDVAYNAFLLNGKTSSQPWTGLVKPGDRVRLRFIGASGATIFHVKIPGTQMSLVQMDGNNIHPIRVDDFFIAPGETYDVLLTITKSSPYIIYAESSDTLGAAVGALASSAQTSIDVKSISPFPLPAPVTRSMMDMKSPTAPMHGMMNMDMGMNMPASSSLPTNKYEHVIAAVKTNDPNKPIAETIHMDLSGYMGRYLWFINGVPEQQAKPLVLQPNKRYRFIFNNTSMMHHPMHLHGHWFILRNGHGSNDPLLHTIDIAPSETITADVDTDASGQWIFHCHLLYHMMSGMARTVQYSSLLEITEGKAQPQNIIENTAYHNRPIVRVDAARPINITLVQDPMAHEHAWWAATNLELGFNPITQIQQVTFNGLYGSDNNKLQLFMNDAGISAGRVENADLDIFYWHWLDQFWAVKGGVNYHYRPAVSPYWQPGLGLEGLMPYFIATDIRTYFYAGSAKLDLDFSRDTQITNNFFIQLSVRSMLASQTVNETGIGSGLNQMQYRLRPYYRIMPGLNIFTEFERDQYYGDFKNQQIHLGNGGSENSLTVGLAVLF